MMESSIIFKSFTSIFAIPNVDSVGNVTNKEAARSLYRIVDKATESIVTPLYGSRDDIFAMVGVVLTSEVKQLHRTLCLCT